MKRIGRIALGFLAITAAVGLWQRENIQAWWYQHQFESVAESEQQSWADKLAEMGGPGISRLLETTTKDRSELCETAAIAIGKRMKMWPAAGPEFADLAHRLLEKQGKFSPPGHRICLLLIPPVYGNCGRDEAAKFRSFALASMGHSDAEVRREAVLCAAAIDPELLRAAVPLMNDVLPMVRRTAVLTVGPARPDMEPIVSSDDLLAWLHDPDLEVRRNCEIALGTRGLSPVEIRLGRQMTHLDPSERLAVLLQLPRDDDFDPAPWLERLSRDKESAVRAGAVRVAAERGVDFADRLNDMARSDPDLTVRAIAEHYRNRR